MLYLQIICICRNKEAVSFILINASHLDLLALLQLITDYNLTPRLTLSQCLNVRDCSSQLLSYPSNEVFVVNAQLRVQKAKYCFLPCLCTYRLANQMPELKLLLGPFSSRVGRVCILFWFYPRQSQGDGETRSKTHSSSVWSSNYSSGIWLARR